MKIGRFLLASFFAGESCGQGTDLAQLTASFSPEQLAALQRKKAQFYNFYELSFLYDFLDY